MNSNMINELTPEYIQSYVGKGNQVYASMNQVAASFAAMCATVAQTYNPVFMQLEQITNAIRQAFAPYEELQSSIRAAFSTLAESVGSITYPILNLYQDDVSLEEKAEINNANEKIISEILQPDQEKNIDLTDSPIIVLSPINDRILKYLSENPSAFYKLSDENFETVMAEIYSRLGYDVTRTQSTRDGGKDIIVRKAEALGDFIYYVECKKYAPCRHIGVGIVRNLIGTVNTDRVNGGILATTSFFTRDARKFVLDNKLNFQIQMHDYSRIQKLLDTALRKEVV